MAIRCWCVLSHLVIFCTLFAAGPASGQQQTRLPAASTDDSIATLEHAKRRLRNYTWDIGGVDDYDGWHNADPARAMYRARQNRPAVIAAMDEFARKLPGDDWILGQRVGLRVKQGLLADALSVAEECGATAWWCSALRGFVLHVMQDYPAAETAFRDGLASMPDSVACAWREEVGFVLRDAAAARFSGASCREREEIEERVWWLADPLYIAPANDRFTEHYSRRVFLWFKEQNTPHEPLVIVQQALVRRGWPYWWWSYASPYRNPLTTPLPDDGVPDLPGVRFVPPAEVVEDPLSPEAGVWGGTPPAALDEERYNPSYGPFSRLSQQTGFLLRGDSILVVVAANTATSSLHRAPRTWIGLVLSRGPDDEPVTVLDERPPDVHRLTATVADEPWLVSVEALASRFGAARARFAHRLPERAGDFGLSDILLFDWDDDAGELLEDVLPRMLPTTRLDRTGGVGIYWEVYGVDAGDDVEITLGVTPHETGLLRRLGEALRLVGRRESVAVEWLDRLQPDEIVSRTLHVDLGTLQPGTYSIEIQARNGAGATVVARRDVEIL